MITDPHAQVPTRDALIRKVRALLAKAKRTDNEAEAMAFAAKARELADIHRLDPETLDPETIGEGDHAKYGLIWSQNVANAIARMFGCGTIQEDGRGGHTTFVGREGDRTTARLMADFFIQRVRILATQHSKEGGNGRSFAVAWSKRGIAFRRCSKTAQSGVRSSRFRRASFTSALRSVLATARRSASTSAARHSPRATNSSS